MERSLMCGVLCVQEMWPVERMEWQATAAESHSIGKILPMNRQLVVVMAYSTVNIGIETHPAARAS